MRKVTQLRSTTLVSFHIEMQFPRNQLYAICCEEHCTQAAKHPQAANRQTS